MKRFALGFLLLVASIQAHAVPYLFSYTGTISAGSAIPGVIDGSSFTVEAVVDNGGATTLSQTWLQPDILSTSFSSGIYSAQYNLPVTVGVVFATDALGNITTAVIADCCTAAAINGGTDNFGSSLLPVLGVNGIFDTVGRLALFTVNTDSSAALPAWSGAAVPEPATLGILALGLGSLVMLRRRQSGS